MRCMTGEAMDSTVGMRPLRSGRTRPRLARYFRSTSFTSGRFHRALAFWCMTVAGHEHGLVVQPRAAVGSRRLPLPGAVSGQRPARDLVSDGEVQQTVEPVARDRVAYFDHGLDPTVE